MTPVSDVTRIAAVSSCAATSGGNRSPAAAGDAGECILTAGTPRQCVKTRRVFVACTSPSVMARSRRRRQPGTGMA